MPGSPRVTAIAGGVGAARFLRGVVGVVPAATVTAVVNTGDDETFHGLHVSPDLDTVTYTLAGASNPETGWGLAGESFRTMGALERYGVPTWFRLGDLDLATHLYRSRRLREGAPLSAVTGEIVRAWGVDVTLLPMSDDPAPTVIETREGERVAMQEWFVRRRAEAEVAAVDLSAAEAVEAAPGVMESLAEAEWVVMCPSNPLISVGPVLAVRGVRALLAERRDRVVGVSPIVGGAAVKGPADRMLRSTGTEVSPVGVASLYRDVCGTFVIDEADAALAPRVEELGMRVVVAPTLMTDDRAAADLARRTFDAVSA